jgi:septum formation protein maf
MKITLASASPRRRQLISRIGGLEVSIIPSGADEHVEASSPEELVKKLALKKAETVFSVSGGIVVGADTVVVADGRVLGKPGDDAEARSFFRLLCGRTHEVITGLAVINGLKSVTASESTLVTFNDFDDGIIERYIADGRPFDKAGGYGIQDAELKPLIAKIEGDEDNVIGLPVNLLRTMLEENF